MLVIKNKLAEVSKGVGVNGLMLCDLNSGYSSAKCQYGSNKCLGSCDDGCNPNGIWHNKTSSSKGYYYYLEKGALGGADYDPVSCAFSVRCVSDL